MNNILIFVISIIVLICFTYYTFLSKTSDKKGKTKITWKVIIPKILQIEFKSEHDNSHKK